MYIIYERNYEVLEMSSTIENDERFPKNLLKNSWKKINKFINSGLALVFIFSTLFPIFNLYTYIIIVSLTNDIFYLLVINTSHSNMVLLKSFIILYDLVKVFTKQQIL